MTIENTKILHMQTLSNYNFLPLKLILLYINNIIQMLSSVKPIRCQTHCFVVGWVQKVLSCEICRRCTAQNGRIKHLHVVMYTNKILKATKQVSSTLVLIIGCICHFNFEQRYAAFRIMYVCILYYYTLYIRVCTGYAATTN